MLVIAATLLTGATLLIIWLLAVPIGPEVCALTYPGPRNCFISDRVSVGIVATVLTCLVYAATLAVTVVAPRYRRFAGVGLGLLALAPILSYLWVAWIPALA